MIEVSQVSCIGALHSPPISKRVPNHIMSGVIVKKSINEVRVRVGTCILLVMLSVDSFNPVKVQQPV